MQHVNRSSRICIYCQLSPLTNASRPLTSRSQSHKPLKYLQQSHKRRYTRPSFAPKPSPDIRHIAQNPGLYEQNCVDRNYANQAKNSWKILELRNQRADLQHRARAAREANNRLQEQLKSSKQGNDAHDVKTNVSPKTDHKELLQKAKALKDELDVFAKEEKELDDKILELALVLPNLSGHYTPVGAQPELLRECSPDGYIERSGISHSEIGAALDLIDFPAAATSSGWGWYFLKNEAALLEQALVQYALSVLMKHGYQIVAPPSIVYSHIASACGFQPRDQNDEQQIYHLSNPAEKDKEREYGLSLAATAEIPLAAMKAGTMLTEADMPLKVAAVSRCYRAEAGARGVDTKGLYRVHEFTKVEMFTWTMPDTISDDSGASMGYFNPQSNASQADQAFDQMIAIQEEILQALGLRYRVLEMPSEELGATASRKQDMEVYFPSRKHKDSGWGEVTSTSNCTDYQTRRLATRLKTTDGRRVFPYTLNGTALAVPRIVAALLENGYEDNSINTPDSKASIKIPECLRTWMGGNCKIPFNKHSYP